MKIETIHYTQNINYCGECSRSYGKNNKGRVMNYCGEKHKEIEINIWQGFPEWCPLPDKEARK